MKQLLILGFIFFSMSSFAENIIVRLYDDINVTLPKGTNIEDGPRFLSKLPNKSLHSLLGFEKELVLNLAEGVVLFIGISDNGKTSKQMNSLSKLNWLTVVSAYTNMIHNNVKKKQEQGYETVSTLTGDNIGKYRSIISRLGWVTEKGVNNLFIADIFHEKVMISIKVTWISDESDSEKIADQVISSLSLNN